MRPKPLPFGASLPQESLRHLLRGHTREQSDHTFQLYLLRQIPPNPVAALKSAVAWLIATCLAALFSALTDHSSFGCTYPSSWTFGPIISFIPCIVSCDCSPGFCWLSIPIIPCIIRPIEEPLFCSSA